MLHTWHVCLLSIGTAHAQLKRFHDERNVREARFEPVCPRRRQINVKV